nr:unnamed protein product [Digitaria exilis]
MPAIDPAAAATDTTRHPALSACRSSHRVLPRFTFRCAMYIATGKYTVSGQKETAPMNPTTEPKKGSSMATAVVTHTERHDLAHSDIPLPYQCAARPGSGYPALDVGEDRLCHDLVGPHQVHHDKGVRHVQQPERLVEAKACEHVVRGPTAERRVPYAPAQQPPRVVVT